MNKEILQNKNCVITGTTLKSLLINRTVVSTDHSKIADYAKKPDLKYLSSFEEKYKINLWSIAYIERFFLKYNKYHKFTSDEILIISEQECKLF